MKVRKAVVAAAGFGTRFLPQTKAMPKEMLPLVDKPIIQYVVEELVEAGIKDIIIVTNQNKRNIEDHFDRPSEDLIANLRLGGPKKAHLLKEVEQVSEMANFIYVRQKGPYGNGTPMLNVEHLIGNEPFIYTWSDDFVVSEPSRFKQMIAAYEEYESSILCAIAAKEEADYRRYGFAGGKEIKPGIIDVKNIVEKPGSREASPSDLATVSGFLFTPDIFKYLHRALKEMHDGTELYWNDALKLMLADNHRVLAYEAPGGRYYDAGDKLEYLKTVVDFAARRDDIGEEFRAFLKDYIGKN